MPPPSLKHSGTMCQGSNISNAVWTNAVFACDLENNGTLRSLNLQGNRIKSPGVEWLAVIWLKPFRFAKSSN